MLKGLLIDGHVGAGKSWRMSKKEKRESFRFHDIFEEILLSLQGHQVTPRNKTLLPAYSVIPWNRRAVCTDGERYNVRLGEAAAWLEAIQGNS